LKQEDMITHIVYRGINEGRMAARDVDSFLTGLGTQLPVSGGIVKRQPYEIIARLDGVVQESVAAAA
jgi:glutamate synthase (NADH)